MVKRSREIAESGEPERKAKLRKGMSKKKRAQKHKGLERCEDVALAKEMTLPSVPAILISEVHGRRHLSYSIQ